MQKQRYHEVESTTEANSETITKSEGETASERYDDGSYHQYSGMHNRRHSTYSETEASIHSMSDSEADPVYAESSSTPSPPRSPPPESHENHRPNSFDQVAEEVAGEMEVFDPITPVEEHEIHEAELIPERNTDRLFSSDEPNEHKIPNEELHENHDEVPREIPHHNSHPDSNSTLGPPPSFNFRSERLSRNVADAMAIIWDRFWADDVRQIVGIIKNRFGQLMPYIRRFLAHLVAFWGGVTYIRRAISAFIRILNKDERVRELLTRIGWASTTTLRVFLSMMAMLMSATLQFYHLMRDRIIPDTRRIIPIVYYKMIVSLITAARRSPWSLFCGPFSLTFGIDEKKLPDRYVLHDKLSVPRDDVSFAIPDVMHTIRETVHRTRRGYVLRQSKDIVADAEEIHKASREPVPEHNDEHTHHNVAQHDEADTGTEVKGEYVSRTYVPTETGSKGASEDDFAPSKTYVPTTDDNETTPDFISRTYVPPEVSHVPDSYTSASISTPVHSQTTDEIPRPPPGPYAGPKYKHPMDKYQSKRSSFGPLTEMTNQDEQWSEF